MGARFEIHVNEMSRAKSFYSKILGWSFSPMSEDGDDPSEYHIIQGQGIGADHGLTGGMMVRQDTSHEPGSAVRGCTMSFEVDVVDDRYKAALDNGGSEALPPTDYPGIGRCAYCEDGEGNIFGMITPQQGDQ